MNITQLIQTAETVASLLPVVGTFVKAVEDVMPAGTSGQQKLETVRAGIQSVYNASGQVAVEFNAIWPHLQSLIAMLVAAYNAVGIFRKTAPAPQ